VGRFIGRESPCSRGELPATVTLQASSRSITRLDPPECDYAAILLVSDVNLQLVSNDNSSRSAQINPFERFSITPGCCLRVSNIAMSYQVQDRGRVSLLMTSKSWDGLMPMQITLATLRCGMVCDAHYEDSGDFI
jgi:hypothetical protein